MIRRLLVVSAAALVAGTTATLALAAAVDAWTHDGALILIALTAAWLPTAITPLLRRHRP